MKKIYTISDKPPFDYRTIVQLDGLPKLFGVFGNEYVFEIETDSESDLRRIEAYLLKRRLPVFKHPPENTVISSLYIKSSPDADWLKDLAAVGAYWVAKQVTNSAIPDAMLGAYTVGRLIEIDKQIEQKYKQDIVGFGSFHYSKFNPYRTASLISKYILANMVNEVKKEYRKVVSSFHIDLENIKLELEKMASEFPILKRFVDEFSEMIYDYSYNSGKHYFYTDKYKYRVAKIVNDEIVIYPDYDFVADMLFEKLSSLIVESVIRHVPGNKGSDGKLREWCIFSHKTGKKLACYPTKKEAKEGLKRMKMFKHMKESSFFIVFSNSGRVFSVVDTKDDAELITNSLRKLNSVTDYLLLCSKHFSDFQPEDYSKALEKLCSVIIGEVASEYITEQTVEQIGRLDEFIETIDELDNIMKENRLKGIISGMIMFTNPSEELISEIAQYQESYGIYPAYSSSLFDVYEFEKKFNYGDTTPDKKQYSDIISIVPPEFSSFVIVFKNPEGEKVSEVSIPSQIIKEVD